jgi:aspartyl-tRNA(Asn)/glutamyl-tRNA(Gln) amidotransferase subunit C
MSQLNKQTIKYLTQLSRIDCTEEEQEGILHDLENILNYIVQLNEIDTSNVAPCDHVLSDIVNVTREDQIGDSMPREDFLGNAPSQVGGFIRVPPVMKQN